MRADPLPPHAVNSQSDGEAGEHCGCGVTHETQGVAERHRQYTIKLAVTFTCQVADGLQFQRLEDGFKRGHLEVHLLADLHIVMFQVSFLVMSHNHNE